MIPKSQHNDSFAGQEFRPSSIANLPRTIIMPPTVQFDRELCRRTVEIQNVAVQRMLTAKSITCKVAVPQMTPKHALRIGCFLSQQTSAIHNQLFYSPAQFPEGIAPHLSALLASGARRNTCMQPSVSESWRTAIRRALCLGLNIESRFQRCVVSMIESLGRCPRLKAYRAPLALNVSV